jgi:hypothetical protein
VAARSATGVASGHETSRLHRAGADPGPRDLCSARDRSASVDAHPAQPAPGAGDIGDPLFPGLGNGGYDVRHYTLDLVYGSAASVQSVPGRVTIDAKATQTLSRFDLDYSGDSVEGVTVDRRAASFTRAGEELVITPARAIRNHHRFVVVVDYTSGPREIAPEDAGDLNIGSRSS